MTSEVFFVIRRVLKRIIKINNEAQVECVVESAVLPEADSS